MAITLISIVRSNITRNAVKKIIKAGRVSYWKFISNLFLFFRYSAYNFVVNSMDGKFIADLYRNEILLLLLSSTAKCTNRIVIMTTN